MQFAFLRVRDGFLRALLRLEAFCPPSTQAPNRAFLLHRGLAYESSMQELSSLTETATPSRIEELQPVLRKHSVGNFLLPCAAESQRFVKGPDRHCMAWTAPHFEEIHLNCEINSYVSAQM
jgi:coenzyme PQQ precursor peptide PqqA